jgi:hypothetical protein
LTAYSYRCKSSLVTTTNPEHFEPDAPARCDSCGKLSDADPCSGSMGHDEGFDRCGCEDTEPAVEFKVDYYDPRRGGVWTATFKARDAAERFAMGRRCYAKPAVVREVA